MARGDAGDEGPAPGAGDGDPAPGEGDEDPVPDAGARDGEAPGEEARDAEAPDGEARDAEAPGVEARDVEARGRGGLLRRPVSGWNPVVQNRPKPTGRPPGSGCCWPVGSGSTNLIWIPRSSGHSFYKPPRFNADLISRPAYQILCVQFVNSSLRDLQDLVTA